MKPDEARIAIPGKEDASYPLDFGEKIVRNKDLHLMPMSFELCCKIISHIASVLNPIVRKLKLADYFEVLRKHRAVFYEAHNRRLVIHVFITEVKAGQISFELSFGEYNETRGGEAILAEFFQLLHERVPRKDKKKFLEIFEVRGGSMYGKVTYGGGLIWLKKEEGGRLYLAEDERVGGFNGLKKPDDPLDTIDVSTTSTSKDESKTRWPKLDSVPFFQPKTP